MEISPLLAVLSLGAITLFGRLYFMSRPPLPKEGLPPETPSCPHRNVEYRYFHGTCAGENTPAMVIVCICLGCKEALPQKTRTLARFPPETLREIHQTLTEQGYDTSALPPVPKESQPGDAP